MQNTHQTEPPALPKSLDSTSVNSNQEPSWTVESAISAWTPKKGQDGFVSAPASTGASLDSATKVLPALSICNLDAPMPPAAPAPSIPGAKPPTLDGAAAQDSTSQAITSQIFNHGIAQAEALVRNYLNLPANASDAQVDAAMSARLDASIRKDLNLPANASDAQVSAVVDAQVDAKIRRDAGLPVTASDAQVDAAVNADFQAFTKNMRAAGLWH